MSEETSPKHGQQKSKKRSKNHKTARRLAKSGLPIFPCKPDKTPHVKGSFRAATTDLRQLDQWWMKWPNALPALPTGKTTNIAVLDIDIKSDKDGMAALEDAGLGRFADSAFTVDTQSGGRHVYFAHESGLNCSASQIADGVDVRADGGYVIAPGAVARHGTYEITSGTLNDMTARGFPRKLFKQLERRKATTSPPPTEPTEPWKIVKAALKTIPNDGGGQSNSRDWWIKMLAALHHESVGSDKGRKLAHSWSNRWPGADPDQTETAWNSFGRGTSKAAGATILFEARAHGWTDPRAAQRILAMFEDLDAKPPKSKSKGLTFLSPSDCAKFEPRPYVLKHVIAEHDIGCIVGQPGVGKSVFAPALAYAIAQGRPFQGQRSKQGKTFYVAAEDEYGMRGRIHALSKEHGPAEDFLLVGGVHDLLNEDLAGHGSADYYALLKAVKKHQPALVVIDTLAMAFPGLEENNAEAMGRVVNVARSLTQWGSAVILVHHDTKDGSGIGRGHSILNGALDMSLHLSRHDNGTLGVQAARSEANTIIGGTLSKNRNGSCGTTFSFTITGTEIGVDQDGDIVTAATLRNATPPNSTTPRLTRSQYAAWFSILEMKDEKGEVSETDWRNAAKENTNISSAEMLESRIKAVSRAMTFLKKNGRITVTDGKIYVQDSSQSELEFSDLGDEN